MDAQRLLTSTSISSTAGYADMLSIRDGARGLAERGEGARAINVLRAAFFHSSFSSKPLGTKKSVLRAVWAAIEKQQQNRFEISLGAGLEMLGEAYQIDWEKGMQMGRIYSAGEVLHSEILAERDSALTIGRCDAIVTLMCAKDGDIVEGYLVALEEMLAVMCGE